MNDSPDVLGLTHLTAKASAVAHGGSLRQQPIDGLIFRPTRPVPHEDGVLTEIARTDWDEVAQPIVQAHLTTTEPGRIRAWGLHRESTDRLFVVRGLVSIVVYDGRVDSPTCGVVNEFKVSERNPGLLVIPPNLFHGWKTIGTEESFVVNMPSNAYDYDSPDALDLPYDSDDAQVLIPWRW